MTSDPIPTAQLADSLDQLYEAAETWGKGIFSERNLPSWTVITRDMVHPRDEDWRTTPDHRFAYAALGLDRGIAHFVPIFRANPLKHYYTIETVSHAYAQAKKITEAKSIDWEVWGPIERDVADWFQPITAKGPGITAVHLSPMFLDTMMLEYALPRNAVVSTYKHQSPHLPDELLASIMITLLPFCTRIALARNPTTIFDCAKQVLGNCNTLIAHSRRDVKSTDDAFRKKAPKLY
jgi:hypothetical protein